MVLYRPQRGYLADAMSEVRSFETFDDLFKFLKEDLRLWAYLGLTREKLEITPYGFDSRIGWDTFLVHLEGYGVVGYLNGDFTRLPTD